MKTLLLSISFSLFLSALFAQTTIITDPVQQAKLKDAKQERIQPWSENAKAVYKENATIFVDAPKSLPRPEGHPTGFFGQKMLNKATHTVLGAPHTDTRNLPLNSEGKLLNPDGIEVDFVVPRGNLRHGWCGTPVPVVAGSASGSRANCPIEVPCDSATNRDANIPGMSAPLTYFKVRWVVVDDGTANSNIDQSDINNLMAELNADFASARINFCTEGARFVTDLTHYGLNADTEDGSLKTTHGDSTAQLINIYVVGTISIPSAGGNAGGYARFPYDPLGGTNIRGGIVLARSNTAIGTHSLSHEMGHVFALHHTFHGVDEVSTCNACYERVTAVDGSGSNGDTEGDWCSDTNPHPANVGVCADPTASNNVCDAFPWNNVPVDNHMSYSFCTNTFTSQQAGRMLCMINTYLGSWTVFGASTCGNLPPVANFSGTPTIYTAPASVTFTDLSQPAGLVTTWTWDFDVTNVGGGTVSPATFSGQTPPTVSYPNPGLYTVRLTATNANGSTIETKTDYINVLAPTTDCDTLYTQLLSPSLTLIGGYLLGPNNYVNGVPNSFAWDGVNTTTNTDFYERFPNPSPGSATVGAVQLGLINFSDTDSSMVLDVVIYNDDGFGAPDLVSGPIGSVVNIEPGGDLGVPGGGFSFVTPWIVFNTPVTPSTATFHAGVHIRNNSANDRLIILSSCAALGGDCAIAEGENDGSNHAGPTLFNYLNNGGVDFDLFIVPMLGEWQATVQATGLGQVAGCDSTLVLLTDTILFSSTMASATFSLDDGTNLSVNTAAEIDSIFLLFTDPGPKTGFIATVNGCGRVDTLKFTLNYVFVESPTADFTKTQANPVCIGAPGVDFTGSPVPGPSITSYTWDFGDGGSAGPLAGNTTNHQYTANGLYYVSLTVTDTAGCSDTEQKLDFVEAVDCSVNAAAAAFSFAPMSACPFQTITFTDASMAVPDPPTSWLWNFGDGNFSTLQNPTHNYTTNGSFTVTLTATNAGGSSVTTSVVTVNCPLAPAVTLTGMAMGQDVGLFWETTTPAVIDQFSLYRSKDGLQFDPVTTVAATGSEQYTFVDPQPGVPRLFYRLTMLDLDGNLSTSNTVEISLGGDSPWIQAFPNPLAPDQPLTLSGLLPEDATVTFRVIDMLGKKAWASQAHFEKGLMVHQLPIGELARGVYLVQVVTDRGARSVMKLVKR